jgi:hypothetical protein
MPCDVVRIGRRRDPMRFNLAWSCRDRPENWSRWRRSWLSSSGTPLKLASTSVAHRTSAYSEVGDRGAFQRATMRGQTIRSTDKR